MRSETEILPVLADAARPADAGERRRVSPWTALWLGPHLLSLDAPLVALGWQGWWARTCGVSLSWVHGAVLALAVWAIYLADRLADAARPERPDTATARHRFSRRWRRPLSGLLLAVLAGLIILSPAALTAADFRAGLALLAVETVYFLLIHAGVGRGRVGWKEAWVGGSFAAGCAFFPWLHRAGLALPAGWWLTLGMFAALCFLNCSLITHWEIGRDEPALGNALRRASAALALAAAGGAVAGSWPAAPVAAGAGGLWWLETGGARLRPETRRVLADAALLAPWAWLALGR